MDWGLRWGTQALGKSWHAGCAEDLVVFDSSLWQKCILYVYRYNYIVFNIMYTYIYMYTYLCVCVFVFNHIRGRWSPITSSSTGGQNFQCLPWDGDPRGQNCLRHDFLMKIMYNIYIYVCVYYVCFKYHEFLVFTFSILQNSVPSSASFVQGGFGDRPGRVGGFTHAAHLVPLGAAEASDPWRRWTWTWCAYVQHTHTRGERVGYIYILYIQLLIITSIYSIHMYIQYVTCFYLSIVAST